MLITTWRDLQWRRRRFVIAIIGTGLVFAMTLILTALANGFRVEARQTVDSLGVDTYLIKAGAVGPFLGAAMFPGAEAQAVSRVPGVESAIPVIFAQEALQDRGSSQNVNIFGMPERGPGMPTMAAGRGPSSPSEVAISTTLGRAVGDDVEIGSRVMRIVGLVGKSTALAGQANAFLTLEGAQQVLFSGQPLVSAVGLRGTAAAIPDGYRIVGRDAAIDDLMRPLQKAYLAISYLAILLWGVAALIVGSLIYLSAMERTRDFAVFKAVGVATRSVLAGLVLQAVIVAVVAAALGVVLALGLAPTFPIPVVMPTSAFVLLPVIAVVIGLLASVAGMRRAITVDPALAFGGP
ncbi:ABC transporter permease [Mycobacterium sp.]|uniref:ABC transporter permease n=1 Tax=Mycobacterium sp. TaxID=1785 RepID=UPI003BAE721D